MNSSYFASLLPEIATRSARATLSKLGFTNLPLRRHLQNLFAAGLGEAGCFVGEPVFEATFGWMPAEQRMGQLAPQLLHPELVAAMDKPWGPSGSEYRFPQEARPYVHQLEAWRALLSSEPHSLVVTSGTGSGKTECFMVPVLNSLARARDGEGRLRGVRALFLYPLNALIQSQRERLRAWTGPFGGDLRFCLYNGNTPNDARADHYREAPNEVHDRSVLRKDPPPIVVTNPTMLEYMLVRAEDAPILDASQGKLEWIILDEAHNYVGSQAAELALLLRRVLHAFGTQAERVRFVATSATIATGDPEAKRQLQDFLARLAGVSADRVVVVEGRRLVPALGSLESAACPAAIEELEAAAEQDTLYAQLVKQPVARRLRDLFDPSVARQSWQPLSAVRDALRDAGHPHDDAQALRWLDVLTRARLGAGRDAVPFLPLRLHAFHDTLDGLWACADPSCPDRRGTALDDAEWPFGQLFLEDRQRCSCGAPVYPLASCDDCSETFLMADLVSSGGVQRLLPPVDEEIDEFALDREPDDETADAGQCEGEGDAAVPSSFLRNSALVVNGAALGQLVHLDPATLELDSRPAEGALPLRLQDHSLVDDELVLACPCCGGTRPPRMQFRRAQLGAPFLLGSIVPTLLEFCPDGEHPLASPMRARRMITFTDSRQGTARIAAQLQQEAERTALRSAVYRKLVAGSSGARAEQAVIEGRLKALRPLLKAGPNPAIEQVVRDDEAALAELEAGAPVPFNEMAEWLAAKVDDIGKWIHRYYADLDQEFRDNAGQRRLAEILLCREFARRPKRQNSLETLGLASVRYPKLASVQVLRPAAQQHGFTLDEWQGFLKLCLDFIARQSFALRVPSRWERWGGNKVYSKSILPPGSLERATRRLIKWPSVRPGKRQHRLVRLLAHVLRLDPASSEGRDRIDSLLLAAWNDLVAVDLLQVGGDGSRYLDVRDFAFRVLRSGWLCPVTGRVLDVTLRGVTPWLPEQIADHAVRCAPVDMPICRTVVDDFPSDAERVRAARGWLQGEPAVQDLILKGVWSSVSDRVVEGGGYYRAVEHSAQQSGRLLQLYEKQFREGSINLMSCSTTMEMGVDIGGINTVAMNNVPPHPANYLQRAGRAGRRGETRSVALTVCKHNPHDQHVLRNTSWPFVTRLPTPGISLSSPALVQRHINALLLSRFLRLQDRQGRLDKLTLEWWMLPRGSSRQEAFVAWCECFDPAVHPDTDAGLASLIRRTVFEGRQDRRALVAETGRIAATHADGWLAEYLAIEGQIAQLSVKASEDEIPLRALTLQRKRLTGEYLLRELATGGLLPGYGFPTDITTFETLNKDSRELTSGREETTREDNRFHRRELPSRDTVTALREYAPGAAVVIDGLVYESAGITLNWHAPATADEVNELQNIRQAWRCSHCGASGTNVLAAQLERCTACGAPLAHEAGRWQQYLEPAGFAVDLFASTHNDITYQRYIPVQPPWISVDAEWIPLPNAGLGAFRTSPDGSVFHHSSGAGRHGYAVCLECGRSAPMGRDGDDSALPAVFQHPHKRLRGRRGKNDDQVCGGSDKEFKIKRGIRFGREYRTDVLELALVGTDGHPLDDRAAAFTIAVALRRAIAERLGVDTAELGCDTKPLRNAAGRPTAAIQVFDLRSGGYASLVSSDLPVLLRRAHQILDCDCADACQHCVLSFDTRFRVDDLDRRAALAFLSDEWLNQLQLPAELRFFGDSSAAEHQLLAEALTRELNRGGASRLYLYLRGSPAEWDLAPSPLRRLVHRLSLDADVEVCLVLESAEPVGLSSPDANILRGLVDACRARLVVGLAPSLPGGGLALASVVDASGTCVCWATVEAGVAVPNATWGERCATPLVRGVAAAPAIQSIEVRLATPTAGASVLSLDRQLDGPALGFGRRFWQLVAGGDPVARLLNDASVVEIVYEDRYLSTPLTLALLLEVLAELKRVAEDADRWPNPLVTIRSMQIAPQDPGARVPRGRPTHRWTSDWPDDALRDRALRAALAYGGLEARVASLPKRELGHARRLTICREAGPDVVIWLDQGLSYWSQEHRELHGPNGFFPFGDDLDAMVQAIASPGCTVQGHVLPTYVFVEAG